MSVTAMYFLIEMMSALKDITAYLLNGHVINNLTLMIISYKTY